MKHIQSTTTVNLIQKIFTCILVVLFLTIMVTAGCLTRPISIPLSTGCFVVAAIMATVASIAVVAAKKPRMPIYTRMERKPLGAFIVDTALLAFIALFSGEISAPYQSLVPLIHLATATALADTLFCLFIIFSRNIHPKHTMTDNTILPSAKRTLAFLDFASVTAFTLISAFTLMGSHTISSLLLLAAALLLLLAVTLPLHTTMQPWRNLLLCKPLGNDVTDIILLAVLLIPATGDPDFAHVQPMVVTGIIAASIDLLYCLFLSFAKYIK